jgi:hypothetical protein
MRIFPVGAGVFALALIAAPAAAQDEPAGAVQGHLLASPQADFGGAVSADVWYPIEMFRIGGFFGAGAIPSVADAQNRVFMPLAVSAAFETLSEIVGVSLRARIGLWGGATQEVKLTAGFFIGGAAHLLFNLGSGVALGAGFDVWGLFGSGETALFAPSVGLTWTPPTPNES